MRVVSSFLHRNVAVLVDLEADKFHCFSIEPPVAAEECAKMRLSALYKRIDGHFGNGAPVAISHTFRLSLGRWPLNRKTFTAMKRIRTIFLRLA